MFLLFTSPKTRPECRPYMQIVWTYREANKRASFIVQSVTKYGLTQSYVATGHPEWLFEFFCQ